MSLVPFPPPEVSPEVTSIRWRVMEAHGSTMHFAAYDPVAALGGVLAAIVHLLRDGCPTRAAWMRRHGVVRSVDITQRTLRRATGVVVGGSEAEQ